MNSNYQKAIDEMLKGVNFRIEAVAKKYGTQNYNGLIVAQSDDKWEIRFNGETHILPQYGNISVPAIGKVVKVFVPQGNMNLAYFI